MLLTLTFLNFNVNLNKIGVDMDGLQERGRLSTNRNSGSKKCYK